MGKKLILYAEDDQDDRFIFENSFAQHRDEVDIQIFNDGLEILNHLKTGSGLQPSLIVSILTCRSLTGRMHYEF